MTPEEALQHEWIREGMVHRIRGVSRNHHKRVKDGSEVKPHDPYKTAAQPPAKGQLHLISTDVHVYFN